MMHIKKTLGTISCLFCFISLCNSQSEINRKIDDIFSPEIIETLRAEGEIIRYQYNEDDVDYVLCPNTEAGKLVLSQWTKEDVPILAVESLYLYKKENPTAPGADTERIGKIMRSVSKMKGISYYSNTRKKEEVLYPDAYTFDNIENKQQIPDDLEGSADGKQLFMFQEDATFGKNYYEVDYHVSGTETLFISRNIAYMYFKIFKVVKPDNLRIGIIINDLGDEVATYLLVQGSFTSFAFLEKYLSRSFMARTSAIYDWFLTLYTEGIPE